MYRHLLLFVACAAPVFAQPSPFIALGDSLGEGVQSLNASDRTQPHGYVKLIADQMGLAFPLPLINTNPLGAVGSTSGRARQNPSLVSPNLAVSAANSGTIASTAAKTPPTDETDLVLAPRTGYTQISAAEATRAPLTICWIGVVDVLGAVTTFDQMNGTQITPVATFKSNIDQAFSRLAATGSRVVYGNIPDVTQIGYLFTPQDLVTFLGSAYGLPQGSYTSLVAMLMIKLGLDDGSILQNPDWVLDASEAQTVRAAVATFNQIVASDAAQYGSPVADVFSLFNGYAQSPPSIGGMALARRYQGGLVSLDGIHPSNTGYALLANQFIGTINSAYSTNIPLISSSSLTNLLNDDPFVDFKGTLQVRGRPLSGLLETLGPALGISGDMSNVPGGEPARITPGVDKAAGKEFMRQYFIATGKNPNTAWTQQDAIEAMHRIFTVQ